MRSEPVILDSERRHKIADQDILPAWCHAMSAWETDEGLTMLIGPDRAARLLEVGVADSTDSGAVIVHAMRARSKFL